MRSLALVLVGIFCSTPAFAEVVTYEYTGVINNLREYVGSNSRAVVSSSVVAGGVRVGDEFHGSFSYDTSIAQTSGTGDTAIYSQGWTPGPAPAVTPTSLTFDKNGSSAASSSWSSVPSVYLQNTNSFDYLSFSTFLNSPGSLISFTFSDANGTKLDSLAIPSTIELDGWWSARMNALWFNPGGDRMLNMDGMLTSLTKVSPVPEPESYAMFLAGLALVSAAVARKRKQLG
jgi:hypothetical protein